METELSYLIILYLAFNMLYGLFIIPMVRFIKAERHNAFSEREKDSISKFFFYFFTIIFLPISLVVNWSIQAYELYRKEKNNQYLKVKIKPSRKI